jgi:hypothetical protein
MADDSDTWTDLQEFMMRQNSLRERLQKRKREREGLLKDVVPSAAAVESCLLLPTAAVAAAAAVDPAAYSGNIEFTYSALMVLLLVII